MSISGSTRSPPPHIGDVSGNDLLSTLKWIVSMDKKRRNLLRSLALAPILLGSRSLFASLLIKTLAPSRLQYSINAFTFNSLLRSGEMTFFDMMEFASTLGLNAVDLTGYYFSDYPKIPDDKTLFQLKKKALQLGLNISWTGVRLSLIHISEPTRRTPISYAVFC